MNRVDGQKVIEYLEGYYRVKLNPEEIKLLSEELTDYNYESFKIRLLYPLLKKVSFFTISELHKVIEEDKQIQEYKQRLGIQNFDEIYEN